MASGQRQRRRHDGKCDAQCSHDVSMRRGFAEATLARGRRAISTMDMKTLLMGVAGLLLSAGACRAKPQVPSGAEHNPGSRAVWQMQKAPSLQPT